jgi:hypothetical protein
LLELRRSFLDGHEPRERVWLLAGRARAASSLESLRARIALAQRELGRLQARAAAGVTSEREAAEARRRLLAHQGEARLLELELERIGAGFAK